MTRPRARTPAFVASEVFVVLAVLAIVLLIAVPPISRAARRYEAYAASREFRFDLAWARVRAILDGETVSLVFDERSGSYRVEAADGTVLRRRRLHRGVALTTTAADGTIPFTARGTSNLYSTTTIAVADDPAGPRYVTRVSPSGAWRDP